MTEADAFEKFKKAHFEQWGKELSDEEFQDIRFLAQMFAEVAYENWKKKLAESKKTVPKDP